MSNDEQADPWVGDLLDYKEIGITYTNLIQSIDDAKVISIEAGFGQGKTFFRKAWAAHLRQTGEVVIEIDSQRSDHSGDPVVTFVGALVAALPDTETGSLQAFGTQSKKFGGVVGRALIKAVLKSGAEEVIGYMTESAQGKAEGVDTLDTAVTAMGDSLSKLARQAITAQMAAERVRTKEMPEQMNALQQALTTGKGNGRVVIVIDELDRCHPDYAIALLEAMKLVFDQDGFVFVLMVNADYLERLAGHRFGVIEQGERYLDKFVDIRLRLPKTDKAFGNAAYQLARKLPLERPFGNDPAFSVTAAAALAAELAPRSHLTMRQVKQVLLKVEVALRCYRDRRLDAPLLLYLAFREAWAPRKITGLSFKRYGFTAEAVLRATGGQPVTRHRGTGEERLIAWVRSDFPELLNLDDECYNLPDPPAGQTHPEWENIAFLSKDYVASHQRVLDGVHSLLTD